MQEIGEVAVDGCTEHGWRNAVHVLTHKFHVVNRRVAVVCVLLHSSDAVADPGEVQSAEAVTVRAHSAGENDLSHCSECHCHVHNNNNNNNNNGIGSDVTSHCWHVAQVCEALRIDCLSALHSSTILDQVLPSGANKRPLTFCLRKLVSKKCDATCEFDLVVSGIDWCVCLPVTTQPRLIPPFAYRWLWCRSSGHVKLSVAPNLASSPSAIWLSSQVLPKLARWCLDCLDGATNRLQSLSLINAEQYQSLYSALKQKYGPYFVSIWPEKTDPLKFVYEDVAIATYLILVWRQTPPRKQFVDLGCGNGLLVHILSSEGYGGYGIDVRSRKIWQVYPSTTRLEVHSVVASVDSTFSDCDWLIGNHSDELTPWIPVMAAATSAQCCFFLLPCCTWNFYSKYQRTKQTCSTYEDYIEFVGRVSEACGFVTEHDRLRIPSTRRRCLIGRQRNDPHRHVGTDDLHALVTHMSSSSQPTPVPHPTSAVFTPRASHVPVARNCTQLPSTLVDSIVRQVALRLAVEDASTADGGHGRAQMSLLSVADLIGSERLAQLRSQCGGVQTLLRNHGHVFCVRGGFVRLQSASALTNNNNNGRGSRRVKTRLCWFHVNLPAGCPLSAEKCRYAHGPDDFQPTV